MSRNSKRPGGSALWPETVDLKDVTPAALSPVRRQNQCTPGPVRGARSNPRRIVVLRAGRVEQSDTPLELYNAPSNAFVAGFIGSPRMNFLKGRIARTEGGIAVALDGIGTIRSEAAAPGLEVGTPVTIGIRPEHVVLGHVGANDVSFVAGHAEQLGGATTLIFPEPGFALQVPARRGETIALNLPLERVHVFDAEDGKSTELTVEIGLSPLALQIELPRSNQWAAQRKTNMR